MRKKILLSSLLALTASLSLLSCQGDLSVSVGNSQDSVDSNHQSSDGEKEGAWADYDKAHVSQEYKGAANSGDQGINLSGISSEEKASLLGDVESWALKNHLLGIPLFGDGGWTLINPRVQPAKSKDIPNYGFGILREGKITSPMSSANEPTEAYRYYLHLPTSSNNADGKLNPFDAANSFASTLTGYCMSGLYGSRLIEDGNGGYEDNWEFYPVLAAAEPEPLDWDETTQTATKWKVKVRTTANTPSLHYSTASTKKFNGTDLSSFNGAAVKAEDYVYSYHLLLNGNNHYAYGAQFAPDIVGGNKYMADSADKKIGSTEDNELFAKEVGIKVLDDETIEFDFTSTMTKNEAMMKLETYGPTNKAFYELVTNYSNDDYSQFNYGSNTVYGGTTYTPADTLLSVGPYTLSKYDVGTGSNNEIIYDRNNDWFEIADEKAKGYDIYSIPGIYYRVKDTYGSDPTASYNDYQEGKLDEASIPVAYKSQWEGDKPGKYVTSNSTITALQINSCDQTRWDEIFGPDGTNWQLQNQYSYDPKTAEAWTVKPIMSNSDFLDGLYFSINREELAESMMAGASSDWMGEAYMVDVNTLQVYDETAAHMRAVKDWLPDQYGYSTAVAQQKFLSAMDALTESGAYQPGTATNPTEIHISIQLMVQRDIDEYGNTVKNYIESNFNTTQMLNKGYKLVVDLPTPPANAMDIYGIIASGCFDLIWGGISGGTGDAFGLTGCYTDSWDYGFMMSVGAPTNVDTGENGIIYDGYSYSMTGIFYAVEYGGPVVITNGAMDWDKTDALYAEE